MRATVKLPIHPLDALLGVVFGVGEEKGIHYYAMQFIRGLALDKVLETQGRFKHLFEPERQEALLAEIQGRVDAYWGGVEKEL